MPIQAGAVIDPDELLLTFRPRAQMCTANTANTSNTNWANPTGMSGIDLESGKTYHIVLKIMYSTAATTTGISLDWLYSGTQSGDQGIGYIQGSATSTFVRSFPTEGQTTGWASVDTAASTLTASLDAWITTTSAGTLTLRFRSEVNGSAATIVAGTFMKVEEVEVV